MKKLIGLILALVLALSLMGCGGYTEEDIAAAKRSAYDEGYDTGYSEGLDAGISDWIDAYDRGYSDGKAVALSDSSPQAYIGEDEQELSSGYKERLAIYTKIAEENGQGSNTQAASNPLSDMGIDDETFDIVVQHVQDNPSEFCLYTERDLELAYESGFEDAGW